MQNPIKEFRQSSIVFEKLVIFSEKLKTLKSSNHHRVEYFFAEPSHTSLSYQCLQEGYPRFFFILFKF